MYKSVHTGEEIDATITKIKDITASTMELNQTVGAKGNLQEQIDGKVSTSTTINGKPLTANVTLTAADVGAIPSDGSGGGIDAILDDAKAYTDEQIAGLINGAPSTLDTLKEIADAMEANESVVGALDEAIGSKADAAQVQTQIQAVEAKIPTKTSQLDNDSGFLTDYTETDPTVPAWAKAATKPSYTASEVGALPDSTVIPSKTSQLINDSGFITSTEADKLGVTYKLSKSGQDIVLIGSDGSTSSAADSDTTYAAMTGATASAAGKAGLVPAPAAGAATRYLRSDGTWQVPPDTNTTYSNATTSAAGLMSATDKTKLNGVAAGAEVNQNAFSNVVVGSTTIAADAKTDTLTLAAGSNVTLTPDATNDEITIAATDTKYSNATTSAAGLMSAADKTKLDGISAGANAITVDSALSSTSTNPVQNKVINSGLNRLQNVSSATLYNSGWYRVAQASAGNLAGLLGGGISSCKLIIGRSFSNHNNEHHELQFLSTFQNQHIISVCNKSNTQIITKARYVYFEPLLTSWLEIYYNASINNNIGIKVTDGFGWQAITPTLTEETVEGVTVVTTCDIPANAILMAARYSTTDLTAGTSALSTGTFYWVYE